MFLKKSKSCNKIILVFFLIEETGQGKGVGRRRKRGIKVVCFLVIIPMEI